MISVTSSVTPLMVVNSWSTPSMRIALIAYPSKELNNTRRRELPTVTPKPGSRGRNSNTPSNSLLFEELFYLVFGNLILPLSYYFLNY
jgi:hypothetical protein